MPFIAGNVTYDLANSAAIINPASAKIAEAEAEGYQAYDTIMEDYETPMPKEVSV